MKAVDRKRNLGEHVGRLDEPGTASSIALPGPGHNNFQSNPFPRPPAFAPFRPVSHPSVYEERHPR